MTSENQSLEGLLLLDKPENKSSFYLVKRIRSLTKVKKVGHAGTLDPFATGLMILLVGKNYTRKSDQFLNCDKAYETTLHLGYQTETFDRDSAAQFVSDKVPTLDLIQEVISTFQGEILQTPPMYSAKKIAGKPLYELARQGKVVERAACKVKVDVTILNYTYPFLKLRVKCSKGTYIRTLGHEIGEKLGCGAYLQDLRRLNSGIYSVEDAIKIDDLENNPEKLAQRLLRLPT